jgi:uncharacterized membrane protein YdbT with pleckstrin-like domain
MRYVDSVLQPGETIRHVATIHWILYLPGMALLVAALIVFVLAPATGALHVVGLGLASALLAVSLFLLARAFLRRWTTEFAITDRRVIYKRGLIWRHTIEMHMDKVESVDVEQSVLGRIFDYGSVIVHGTGSGWEPVSEIGAPLEFRNHITAT